MKSLTRTVRRVKLVFPERKKLVLTGKESWQELAAFTVANAPNPDWAKSYTELPGTFEVPIKGYGMDYKEHEYGTAKAVAFAFDKPEDSFVGFMVATFNGITDASPIINLDGRMTEESKERALRSVAGHLSNRRCPKCGRNDTKKYSRTRVRCGCGYNESTL